MFTRQEVVRFCKTFPDVYEDYPFSDTNWTCMRIKKNHKVFAWISKNKDLSG